MFNVMSIDLVRSRDTYLSSISDSIHTELVYGVYVQYNFKLSFLTSLKSHLIEPADEDPMRRPRVLWRELMHSIIRSDKEIH